ncbi:MAG TPA: hypothetical protein VMF69_10090 [Gemmataceae bacterium]|nr:hypothetical protein [Gemmataceae bacterium]
MLYRVYNQGEIPSLAHGWRSIIALTPGRKWITVIDWTTLETARLEIALWVTLTPQPDACLNRRKVRIAMRRHLRYVAPTEPIREALRLLKESGA